MLRGLAGILRQILEVAESGENAVLILLPAVERGGVQVDLAHVVVDRGTNQFPRRLALLVAGRAGELRELVDPHFTQTTACIQTNEVSKVLAAKLHLLRGERLVHQAGDVGLELLVLPQASLPLRDRLTGHSLGPNFFPVPLKHGWVSWAELAEDVRAKFRRHLVVKRFRQTFFLKRTGCRDLRFDLRVDGRHSLRLEEFRHLLFDPTHTCDNPGLGGPVRLAHDHVPGSYLVPDVHRVVHGL